MEMENPRRSFDRSGVVKKPRLTEDSNRPFTQRSAATPRFTRTNDTVVRDPDADDLGRAGAYQPQTPHHELVSQYKSALAELTFNSKPIITNLTIIAGENVQAAKAIAATVCANILEVPSEQKLPSLYLLDSIVKNIGREYVKHFAPRLPEVFCKAYKQVDASIHQSMRHLFGTWKGVFPLQTLQMIEKELGFTPMVNGSSSGAASSRPDSQSNRHSIHVNPKYLEKQRLQQSSRAKGTGNDMTGAVPSSTADIERPDRPPSVTTGRQLVDPQAKMHGIQRSQRDAISQPVHEKNIGARYGDYEYGSDLSRNSGMGIGRGTGRVIDQAHDKTWFGTDVSLTETMSEQRNGFNVKHGFPNYSAPKSANVDLHLQPRQRIASRSSSGMSSSWKNSEEEEFMWDMPSRLSDQNAADICINPRRENWTPDDPDKMGFENHLRKPQSVHDVGSRFNRDTSSDSLSTEQKDHAVHGQRMPSPWRLQEPNSVDGYSATLGGLPTSGGSQGRLGVRPPIGTHVGPSSLSIMSSSVLGSTGSLGQQRLHSGRAGSPSGQSAIPQRSPSPSVPIHQTHQRLGEQDFSRAQSLSRSDIKTSPFRGNLNTGPHGHSTKESSTLPTKIQPSNLQKVQIPDLKGTVPPGHQSTFSQHLQLGNKQLEHSIQSQKPLLPPVSNFGAPTTLVNESDPVKPHDVQTSGQPSTSSLLAAVFKSGILSNNLVNNSLANSTSQDVKQISAQSDIQPPLPSGHAPTPRKSSDPRVGSESASGPASRGKPLATANSSKRKVEQTQLPPVRPSSSLGPSSAQASSHESKASTPISTLLSSLVAKGLISASKSESPSLLPPQIPTQLSNQSSSVSATKPLLVSSAPSLPPVLPSTGDEISISNPTVECLVKLPHSIPEEIDNLIGFEFKPDIIREQHPDVVSALFDDLPHRCSQCGLRLKLKERLDRHLEWHNVKHHGPDAVDEMSRRWYANSNDWVAGKVGVPLGFESTVSTSELRGTMDNDDEPMVPADDNQYACVLCGELFEDYYSQERDEWMFTRAVYMTLPSVETSSQGPIVHVECISESSARDVGLVSNVKLEKVA